ncbi:MAG TPA: hypothetical protein VFY73_21515 [Ideonella sp.]|uniref:hypothetical protein n=1 Tax=Ideonella sp. TaxID=1929293 RepID=UPI002E36E5AD|nr:hypothetical protein [Ideonella sp.]HEX5686613.1 hypothetical protein [Ideonella sp.]
MRADMSKVLVEEPRHGRHYARAVAGARRLERHRIDPDGESAPSRFSMKQGWGNKSFGEHLSPLYAYLRQQVDRPWNKVYSELCQAIDRRSTVQNHLFQHLYDRVEVDTEWRDGEVWVRRTWRGTVPLSESRAELYVHPRTGILLVNRARVIAKRRRATEQAADQAAAQQDRRTGLAGMPANEQWHRVDGVWYAVTLATLPCQGADPKRDLPVYDVLLKRTVTRQNHDLLTQRYGCGPRPPSACGHRRCRYCPCRYAIAKRQLDTRTLRQHGLNGSASE